MGRGAIQENGDTSSSTYSESCNNKDVQDISTDKNRWFIVQIGLWNVFLAWIALLGLYCTDVIPKLPESKTHYDGSCAVSLHPTSEKSNKEHDKVLVVEGTATAGGTSRLSVWLVAGGFALVFMVIACSLISANRIYRELLKLDISLKSKEKNWIKYDDLLKKSRGILNQHRCFCCGTCNMKLNQNQTSSKSITCSNCTINGSMSITVGSSQPNLCKSGQGDGLVYKPAPVLHADYKVIEAMLENLADDPSKQMFV